MIFLPIKVRITCALALLNVRYCFQTENIFTVAVGLQDMLIVEVSTTALECRIVNVADAVRFSVMYVVLLAKSLYHFHMAELP